MQTRDLFYQFGELPSSVRLALEQQISAQVPPLREEIVGITIHTVPVTDPKPDGMPPGTGFGVNMDTIRDSRADTTITSKPTGE